MRNVTVIMAVLNGLPYLQQAIDSILNQTYQNFEFIIIDDGSTDDTREYLNSLNDERIKVIHQDRQGQGAARNIGINMCKTEYVAMMDADDISADNRLEKQLNYLHRHPDIGMLGTQIGYISSGSRSGFSPFLPNNHEAIAKHLLLGQHAMCNASIMCRTKILKNVGGYRIGELGEDWDMFLRMSEKTRLANLNEILYLYRIHPKSDNSKAIAKIRLRQAHSCKNARLRMMDKAEIPYDEYLQHLNGRSLVSKIVFALDVYAYYHYRKAISEILDNKPAVGYARLVWSSLFSPNRSVNYIKRHYTNKISTI